MSETPVETTDPTPDAAPETAPSGDAAPASPDAAPVKRRGRPPKAAAVAAEEDVPQRTKPRTVDSDEPSLGWTVQHGTPFVDSDAAPGQVLSPEIAADQPVVGGALYVEAPESPVGYQQLVQ